MKTKTARVVYHTNIHVKTLASLTREQASCIDVLTVNRPPKNGCNYITWFGKNRKLSVVIDYPLSHKHKFNVDTGGFCKVGELAWMIAKEYERIYEVDRKNPGEYGIWGHDIGDLYIESIEISGDKVTLGMGS